MKEFGMNLLVNFWRKNGNVMRSFLKIYLKKRSKLI
jgi:hypothetical protein